MIGYNIPIPYSCLNLESIWTYINNAVAYLFQISNQAYHW